MKVAALGIFCPPAPPLRLSRPRLSRLRPKYKSVRYRKAASAVPNRTVVGRFRTEKRLLPYQNARRGGSVQKSGLCRTKTHGGEVPYRKAASAVPKRTAGRFRTEKRPLPYQTARRGGSVQKSGHCRTKPHGRTESSLISHEYLKVSRYLCTFLRLT